MSINESTYCFGNQFQQDLLYLMKERVTMKLKMVRIKFNGHFCNSVPALYAGLHVGCSLEL